MESVKSQVRRQAETQQFKVLTTAASQVPLGYQKQFMKPQAIKVNSHRSTNGLLMNEDDAGGFQGDSIQDCDDSSDQFDGSEIFNDVLGGGGVEPSIDDTIRDSIKYSFVSSEGGGTHAEEGGGLMLLGSEKSAVSQISITTGNNNNANKDNHVMNRMNWITLLKVLFDELESFQQHSQGNQVKQKHVEQGNFVKALRKIKNMLPLMPRLEYMRNCGDVAFSYKDVESGLLGNASMQANLPMMPRYLSWDNIIDMFLTRQAAAATYHVQAIPQQSQLNQNLMTEESMISAEVNLRDDEESLGGQVRNRKTAVIHKNQLSPGGQDIGSKLPSDPSSYIDPSKIRKTHIGKNQEFFLSFADSVIKMNNGGGSASAGGVTSQQTSTHHQQQDSQIQMAQVPLLQRKTDNDEACAIDSDDSSNDADADAVSDEEEQEEAKTSHEDKMKKNRDNKSDQLMEESVRSSRTANFKGTALNGGQSMPQNNNQSNVFSTINTQDSYYGSVPTTQILGAGLNTSSNGMSFALQKQKYQEAQQYYKNTQVAIPQEEEEHSNSSRCSSRRGGGGLAEQDREAAIRLHQEKSGSQKAQQSNTSLQVATTYQEQQPVNRQASSQLLKPMRQDQFLQGDSYKNTLIKGSVASASQQSVHSANTVMVGSGNFLDIDFQNKGLRTLDMDLKLQRGASLADKKHMALRSLNLAQNQLQRVPPSLEKSLQYLNISYNKLKSLNGIEPCINLKFLNASHNLIASVQGIVILQSLRELDLSTNMISTLKEIGLLKNLQLLDLGYNKLIESDKLVPLTQLKKLQTLVLQGNLLQQKYANYESIVKKLLPMVQVLDPDQLQDFSQFQEMQHVCFPQIYQVSDEYDGQSMLQMNDKLQLDMNDADLPVIYAHTIESNRPGAFSDTQSLKRQSNRPQEEGGDHRQSTPNRQIINKTQKQSNELHSRIKSPMRSTKNAPKLLTSAASMVFTKDPIKRVSAEPSIAVVVAKESRSQTRGGGGGPLHSIPLKQQPIADSKSKVFQVLSKSKSRGGDRSASNPRVPATAAAIKGSQIPFNKLLGKQTLEKKLSSNISIGKLSNLGAATGRTTPRQSAFTDNYGGGAGGSKQIFNRTTNVSALEITKYSNIIQDNEQHMFERQSQSSLGANNSSSQHNQSLLTNLKYQVSRQGQVGSKLMMVKTSKIDVSAQVYNSMIVNSSKVSLRPVTSLKQRSGTSQKQEEDVIGGGNQSILPFQHYQPPMTSKNKQQQQSFLFDSDQMMPENSNTGRQTPVMQHPTQLQRFINASKSATRENSKTPATGPKSTALKAQGLTNLPPRAYQSRLENPGDKKSKADNISIVSSSGGRTSTSYALALGQSIHQNLSQNLLLTSNNNQSLDNKSNTDPTISSQGVMQTGGTHNEQEEEEEEEESKNSEAQEQVFGLDSVQYFRVSKIGTGLRLMPGHGVGGGSSGGSMSPVCDESKTGKKPIIGKKMRDRSGK